MTTLEFMEKELQKHQFNLDKQKARNAPINDIERIKDKIAHYSTVCNILKGGAEG